MIKYEFLENLKSLGSFTKIFIGILGLLPILFQVFFLDPQLKDFGLVTILTPNYFSVWILAWYLFIIFFMKFSPSVFKTVRFSRNFEFRYNFTLLCMVTFGCSIFQPLLYYFIYSVKVMTFSFSQEWLVMVIITFVKIFMMLFLIGLLFFVLTYQNNNPSANVSILLSLFVGFSFIRLESIQKILFYFIYDDNAESEVIALIVKIFVFLGITFFAFGFREFILYLKRTRRGTYR